MGSQNQNIYNTTYEGVEANLTPPNHRTPKWLAWVKALLFPLQWLHNNFFSEYANGSTAPFIDPANISATWNKGDKVIDVDNNVYECQGTNIPSFGNNAPYLNSSGDNPKWLLVCNDYRGVRPRTLFNSQKLVLEKILNQYFRTTFRQPPYTEILGVAVDSGGSGYIAPVAVVTGQAGSGRGFSALVEMFPLSSVVEDVFMFNSGLGYLNPTVAIKGLNYDGTPGPGSGATAHLITNNRQPSDIFINNNSIENFVFVVGHNETQSSTCVHSDVEAGSFAEYSNDEYNFADPNNPFTAYDFTIYVPEAVYNSLGSSPLEGIEFSTTNFAGNGYLNGPTSVSISGGNGSGATAIAFRLVLGSGPLTKIILTNGGQNYTSDPTITVGPPTGSGTHLTATAKAIFKGPQRDNVIRNVADKYVIAGMTYNIVTY